MKCLLSEYRCSGYNLQNREIEIVLKVPMPLDPRSIDEVDDIIKKLKKMLGTMVTVNEVEE